MNLIAVVAIGIIVSVFLGLIINRRDFTLGTVFLGTLGAVLGESTAKIIFSDYQMQGEVLLTACISIFSSFLLILLQRIFAR